MELTTVSTDIINQNASSHNPLQFLFEDYPVRIVQNSEGEPLFIASDVCKALEISNVSNVLSRLDDDEKDDVTLADVIGRMQSTAAITEAGLYSLIIRSDKPKAKAFKRWITHEVIPAIRKTGSYEVPKDLSPIEKSRRLLNVLVSIQDTVEAQQHLLDDHTERIASLEAHVQPEIEHFTVMGYCHKYGKTVSLNEAQSIGQRASRLSKERGVSIGKTSDPRFGEVNTYHVTILSELVKG